jgi:hypothetical protein
VTLGMSSSCQPHGLQRDGKWVGQATDGSGRVPPFSPAIADDVLNDLGDRPHGGTGIGPRRSDQHDRAHDLLSQCSRMIGTELLSPIIMSVTGATPNPLAANARRHRLETVLSTHGSRRRAVMGV